MWWYTWNICTFSFSFDFVHLSLVDSRAGWNCNQCCKCSICRNVDGGSNGDGGGGGGGGGGRSVKCEQCQKAYHTNCLRPIISSVPKYGWKCNVSLSLSVSLCDPNEIPFILFYSILFSFSSVVVCVVIAVLGHLEPVPHHVGIVIIRSVIPVISNVIKDSHVPSVIKPIVLLHIRRWLNVVIAISMDYLPPPPLKSSIFPLQINKLMKYCLLLLFL